MSQSQPNPRSRDHGSEPRLIDDNLLREWPLPKLAEGDDKDDRGRVVVVGGALEMPGALILAGTAALRAGAGKVQMATCKSIAQAVAIAVPEALVAGLPETARGGIDATASTDIAARANAANALLIGPGMVDEDAVDRLMSDL